MGFPELKFLSLRRSFAEYTQSKDVLLYLLNNAIKIEHIDLQGCKMFDMHDMSAVLGNNYTSYHMIHMALPTIFRSPLVEAFPENTRPYRSEWKIWLRRLIQM